MQSNKRTTSGGQPRRRVIAAGRYNRLIQQAWHDDDMTIRRLSLRREGEGGKRRQNVYDLVAAKSFSIWVAQRWEEKSETLVYLSLPLALIKKFSSFHRKGEIFLSGCKQNKKVKFSFRIYLFLAFGFCYVFLRINLARCLWCHGKFFAWQRFDVSSLNSLSLNGRKSDEAPFEFHFSLLLLIWQRGKNSRDYMRSIFSFSNEPRNNGDAFNPEKEACKRKSLRERHKFQSDSPDVSR